MVTKALLFLLIFPSLVLASPTFSGGGAIASDVTYNSTSWDANTDAATKNTIRDKIETLGGGHDPVTLAAGVNALTLLTQEIGTDATVEQLADLTPTNNAMLGFDGSGNIENKTTLILGLDTAATAGSLARTTGDAIIMQDNGAGDADATFSNDTTNAAAYEVQLNNEAGLYAVLSDIADFLQAGDDLGTPSAAILTNATGTASGLTSGKATNIAGGLGGQIPYQSAVDTTALLANGTSGQILQSNGTTAAPSWVAASAGDALVANPLSQFAATTSAELAGVISNETGSGLVVLATSPTLATPALGTPSAVILTNATGTASSLTAGNATYMTSGFRQTFTAGENVAVGDLVYFKSDSKLWKTDADVEATTNGMLAVATGTVSADAAGTFVLLGETTGFTGLTIGGVCYVSLVAGEITQTRPSLAGDFVRVVGYATTATTIMFLPSGVWVEI